MQSKWIRWRRAARALCRTPVLADAGDCEGQSVELHSLRMLEMPTNSPFALSTSTPCGCWRWRRTSSPCVCRTPILADAGDGEGQSVWNSTPCGCWRWRRTVRALYRTPILADAGDGEGQTVSLQSLRMLEMPTNSPCALANSNPCGCWRYPRTVR